MYSHYTKHQKAAYYPGLLSVCSLAYPNNTYTVHCHSAICTMRDKPELAAFAVTRKLYDHRARAQSRVRNRSLCDMAFCTGPGFFSAAERQSPLFLSSVSRCSSGLCGLVALKARRQLSLSTTLLYLGCKPIKIWPIGP